MVDLDEDHDQAVRAVHQHLAQPHRPERVGDRRTAPETRSVDRLERARHVARVEVEGLATVAYGPAAWAGASAARTRIAPPAPGTPTKVPAAVAGASSARSKVLRKATVAAGSLAPTTAWSKTRSGSGWGDEVTRRSETAFRSVVNAPG